MLRWYALSFYNLADNTMVDVAIHRDEMILWDFWVGQYIFYRILRAEPQKTRAHGFRLDGVSKYQVSEKR